jgi:pimeloyl-ACP methyl ester carboxylesterase
VNREYSNARIDRYRIQDATIAVRVFGRGLALVFIHGYPLHGYTWRKLLPTLSKDFSCYVVDLPGLGDSDWSSYTDFSFTAQARRLGLLLELLNLPRYALLAHDTGATIGRLEAIAHSDRVTKLIMINTEIPGHRPPRVSLYRCVASLPGAGAIFRLLLRSPNFIRSSMGEFYSDRNLLDEPSYLGPYVQPLINSSKRMAGALGYLRGIEWEVIDGLRQHHARIQAETLFLWGEDDRTFPVELAEEMCGQFTAPTRFIRLADSALLPHEEQPETLLTHVMPFLKG